MGKAMTEREIEGRSSRGNRRRGRLLPRAWLGHDETARRPGLRGGNAARWPGVDAAPRAGGARRDPTKAWHQPRAPNHSARLCLASAWQKMRRFSGSQAL